MATIAEVAEHIDVNTRTAADLVARGIITKSTRGSYDLDAVRLEYIPHIREVAAGREVSQAEMLVQTEKQKLERKKVEADIQTTQAQAEADSNLARAKAETKGVKLKGEAEPAVIKAKSDALQQSPNIVELTKAE